MGTFQKEYKRLMDRGVVGGALQKNVVRTYSNSAGSIRQVTPIDIGTATNSTAYTVTVFQAAFGLNETVSFTTDANATTVETRDGLIAALRLNSKIYSELVPESVDADTFKLTARPGKAGIAYNVTLGGGGAGYAKGAETLAALSAVIPFGRMLTRKSTDDEKACRLASATTDFVLGISLSTHYLEMIDGVAGYGPQDSVNVLRSGVVIVEVEEAITAGSGVYWRGAVDGAFTVLGVFADSAGTGKVLLSQAVWSSSDYYLQGVRVAELEINLP